MYQPTSNTHHLPIQGYLRIPQILGKPRATPPIPPIIPVSPATWWTWVKEGKAPKPYKLGPKITAWKAEDIYQFLEDLSANDQSVA
jgi:prophage regulatory protein